MRSSFWIALVFICVGLLILFLPDDDARVFSFNAAHGPSMQDLVGLTFIIVSWIWLLSKVISRWRMVLFFIGKKGVLFALLAIITGSLVIAQAILNDHDPTLITGILLATAGYSFIIIPAFRTDAD